jgi:hypothetical protein
MLGPQKKMADTVLGHREGTALRQQYTQQGGEAVSKDLAKLPLQRDVKKNAEAAVKCALTPNNVCAHKHYKQVMLGAFHDFKKTAHVPFCVLSLFFIFIDTMDDVDAFCARHVENTPFFPDKLPSIHTKSLPGLAKSCMTLTCCVSYCSGGAPARRKKQCV